MFRCGSALAAAGLALVMAGSPAAAAAAAVGGAPVSAAQANSEPRDADGYARRGSVRISNRNYEGAAADFTRAIELAPQEPGYYYQRAMVRSALKETAPAIADLDEALKLEPGLLEARVFRAGLRIDSEDVTGAMADLDFVDRQASRIASLRLQLANLYEEAGRTDAAIGQYDLWIAGNPRDDRLAGALNGRCWVRALAGKDLDKALDDCNRAARARRNNPSILDSRGLVHLRLGQYDRAIADYDAALKLEPKMAWSLYGRGLARHAKGLRAQGDADIVAAAAISPRIGDEIRKHGIDAVVGSGR